jgi:hypothetical protein
VNDSAPLCRAVRFSLPLAIGARAQRVLLSHRSVGGRGARRDGGDERIAYPWGTKFSQRIGRSVRWSRVASRCKGTANDTSNSRSSRYLVFRISGPRSGDS